MVIRMIINKMIKKEKKKESGPINNYNSQYESIMRGFESLKNDIEDYKIKNHIK